MLAFLEGSKEGGLCISLIRFKNVIPDLNAHQYKYINFFSFPARSLPWFYAAHTLILLIFQCLFINIKDSYLGKRGKKQYLFLFILLLLLLFFFIIF